MPARPAGKGGSSAGEATGKWREWRRHAALAMRGLGPCLLVPVLLAAMPAFAADLQVTDLIAYRYLGDAEQVVPCDGVEPGDALRRCLLPNRRVEVRITTVADVD